MPSRQLASGKWQSRFKLGGVPYSKSTFTSQADADEWEAITKARAKLEGAPAADKAFLTVNQYADRWLATYRTPTKSANTLEHHDGALRNHILPVIGRKRMRDVTATDVQKVVDLATANVSAHTGRAVFATLSAMFTYAVDGDRVINVSPVLPKKHKPKVQKTPMTWLEPAEARAVMMQLEGGWPRDVFILLTQTGARFGEVAGLAARGDYEDGKLDFRRTVDDKEVGPLKNHKRRQVPLSRMAAQVVDRWMEQAGEVAPIGDLDLKLSDREQFRYRWLLQNARGGHLDSGHFAARHFKPALEAAGIRRRVRVHDLRHSYVSWQIDAGHPVGKIAQWIGDLPSTVERTYAHMLKGAGQEGADSMDALFS